MSLRFRRSKKVGKYGRINLTKSGAPLAFPGRGSTIPNMYVIAEPGRTMPSAGAAESNCNNSYSVY